MKTVNKNAKNNSEEIMHIFVASYLRKLQSAGVDFLWWHCPNGGSRHGKEAANLKLMGVLAGVPDIQIMCDGRIMFIELKAIYGTLSEKQELFISSAKRMGHECHVLYGRDIEDMIRQVAKVTEEFFINHSGISSISNSSLLSCLASRVLEKS